MVMTRRTPYLPIQTMSKVSVPAVVTATLPVVDTAPQPCAGVDSFEHTQIGAA